jgi:signal transduction histidine kinase
MPLPADAAEQILVAAPVGRDGELTARILVGAGFSATRFTGAAALADAIRGPAGLVVVAEEVLDPEGLPLVSAALAAQPAWSDLPVLVFLPTSGGTRRESEVVARLRSLGNVSLLERPTRIATLISAVQAGIRSRRRQYLVRDLLLQLEDGVRQRDRFLAMLGHELRNPLGAITMAAEVMAVRAQERGDAPDRQLEAVRRQARLLARLVDDLLEVARVTTGKVQLALRRLDVREAITHALEAMASVADRHGVQLFAEVAAGPLFVTVDPHRLEQILYNLLHNAIKFTPAGGRVTVSAHASGDRVSVLVRDTGAGIEPEMLPRVFDLFGQAPATLDRSEGGLGIGLTLVRSLVQLHGGTVDVRSEGPGRGSEFEVTLPAAAADAAADAAASERAATPHLLRGRRLHVAEDHADNRAGLVELLRSAGCEVSASENGLDALGAILSHAPEAALLDIGLPGLDGYEVAARARAALGNRIVLVAITGYGQPDDRARALAAGFDAHLTKPVDFGRLQRLLGELLPAIPAAS